MLPLILSFLVIPQSVPFPLRSCSGAHVEHQIIGTIYFKRFRITGATLLLLPFFSSYFKQGNSHLNYTSVNQKANLLQLLAAFLRAILRTSSAHRHMVSLTSEIPSSNPC